MSPVLGVVLLYLAVVLGIGFAAQRVLRILFVGAIVNLVAVSLLTSPPSDRVLDRFFPAR